MSHDVGHEASATRQQWAAIMLARTPDVCTSILNGEPVLVRQLEQAALRRALRGQALPDGDQYITVTIAMLAAIHEGGSFDVADGRLEERK